MTIKIHDLKPAAGLQQAQEARRPRHRRQGRQDRRPRHQGPEGHAATSPPPSRAARCRCTCGCPKLKGFNNPFRVEYQAINLDTIEASGLDEISPATLHGKGLAHKGALVKVLGRGELTRKVTVKAHAFSKSAEAAITAAGGTVEILPKPWGDRRPPAKGNQFANR